MSKAYEFLRECGAFFVLTVNGDCPAGRPFGAIMEDGEYLYIATNDRNNAHEQMRKNGNIQLVAKKEASREWIRVSGVATECNDQRLIDKMFNPRRRALPSASISLPVCSRSIISRA